MRVVRSLRLIRACVGPYKDVKPLQRPFLQDPNQPELDSKGLAKPIRIKEQKLSTPNQELRSTSTFSGTDTSIVRRYDNS
jgi:hypothetical protein